MEIDPYGDEPFRVKGKYEGTTTFDSNIPSTWYVVEKKLELLLSGELAEKLGIISLTHVSHVNNTSSKNQYYIQKFPKIRYSYRY